MGEGLKPSSIPQKGKEKMRYKVRKKWRHFRYWLVNKLIPEEEKKVLFNIRIGFYGYREKEGDTEWEWE